MSDARVTRNDDASRYEAYAGDDLAGVLDFRPLDGDQPTMVLPHTGVEPAYEGQGIGSQLTRYALDDLRERGVKVRPDCPFIATWIERHPEYADLVA